MSADDRVPCRPALEGKVALITGGAAGIGRATAVLFAREGAAVTLVDLNATAGAAATDAIVRDGGRARFVLGDVSRLPDCREAVDQTVGAFGRLDVLFNNAGIVRRASVMETSEADWDRVMAVNVKSIFLMSRSAIPVMQKSGGGAIVNTASGWGLVGGRRAAAYCASKGAVVQLTKAMALDLAEHNIRVNCICPGDTDTDMLRSEAAQLGQPLERFLTDAADRPLKRLGRPDEIARAVLFLASDASAFVTGTSLVVDGGGLAG
jgi:NAD(P)-dependent dehydrogenase (short-subunit alcohol dehydrogenase family)